MFYPFQEVRKAEHLISKKNFPLTISINIWHYFSKEPDRLSPLWIRSGNFSGSWIVSSNSVMICCNPPTSSQRTSGIVGAFMFLLCQRRTRPVHKLKRVNKYYLQRIRQIEMEQLKLPIAWSMEDDGITVTSQTELLMFVVACLYWDSF